MDWKSSPVKPVRQNYQLPWSQATASYAHRLLSQQTNYSLHGSTDTRAEMMNLKENKGELFYEIETFGT